MRTAVLAAASGVVLLLTACGAEEEAPDRIASSPITASGKPATSAPSPASGKGCPKTFTETDDREVARTEADAVAALKILASPGRTVACAYSKDEDSPADTLGVWERNGPPVRFKEKWENEAPQVTTIGQVARTGPRRTECDTGGVDFRFVYARHTEAGSAYLVQDTFGCYDTRAVTGLGAVDLTPDDVLLDLSQQDAWTALEELRARMSAG